MTETTCYVQSPDWVKFWQGKVDAIPPLPTPIYAGPERRIALSDRRHVLDRRDDGVKGRRYRVVDRRRG